MSVCRDCEAVIRTATHARRSRGILNESEKLLPIKYWSARQESLLQFRVSSDFLSDAAKFSSFAWIGFDFKWDSCRRKVSTRQLREETEWAIEATSVESRLESISRIAQETFASTKIILFLFHTTAIVTQSCLDHIWASCSNFHGESNWRFRSFCHPATRALRAMMWVTGLDYSNQRAPSVYAGWHRFRNGKRNRNQKPANEIELA